MILGQSKSYAHARSNGLYGSTDVAAMDVAMFLQLCIGKLDHGAGNGKSQAFAASSLGEDKGVDSHHVPVHINQRSATVSGVDGGIRLNIDHRA